MALVPLTAFTPDQPQIVVAASNNIVNCIPITETSYGPLPSVQVYSTALLSRCQGAYAMQDNAGNVAVFAGDIANLYRLVSGTLDPAVVSDGAGYSTGAGERWTMTLFGLTMVATNYTDVPQGYTEGTSSVFAQLIQNGVTSLKARYVATVRDFLMFGNTNDDVDGVKPQRVHWSAINDPTNFPTQGTSAAAEAMSDSQDLVGEHGWVMGVVGNVGAADALIFMERAVFRAVFQGPPTVFSFTAMDGARGCPAPGSIVRYEDIIYYLSDQGFHATNGTVTKNIGFGKVDRFFYKEVDLGQLHRVTSAADPQTGIVFWAYPTNSSPVCNRMLIYNPNIDRWSVSEVDAVSIDVMLKSLSFGFTLDSMDGLFPNADDINISADSRFWTGGRLLLSCFNSDHKLAHFNGTPFAATVETHEANIFPGRRGMVTEVRPIVDGATATVAIGCRDNPTHPVLFTQPAAMTTGGQCMVRAAGRYQKARITVPASDGWEHISGIEITKAAPLGAR